MSDLDSARNSVDAVKGLNSDTNVKDTDFFGMKPLPKPERERTYGSWYFRAGGRLTRTLSRQFALTLDEELYEEFAAEWGRRRSSRRGKKFLVAAVLAVLLAFLAGLAVRWVAASHYATTANSACDQSTLKSCLLQSLPCRNFSRAAVPAAAGVRGTAQFIFGFAAWHKGSEGHTADYYDLGAMYRMCGQAKLPAIQVRLHAASSSLLLLLLALLPLRHMQRVLGPLM
jgi:hypothetical protein